jgi:glutamate-1-semialdehyde 2,1-aminomutase
VTEWNGRIDAGLWRTQKQADLGGIRGRAEAMELESEREGAMTGTAMTTDLLRRAADVLPGGVSSNVRLQAPRVFFERGAGARLWDSDGHEYVDYLLGQGPAFLGHAHPKITQAVSQAVAKGMVFGAQHPGEVLAVEKFLAVIGWADMARLGVSGTEAVHGALRLARAATARRKVVRFAGQYHGWLDTVLMNFTATGWGPASQGQSMASLDDWIVTAFNDVEALKRIFEERSGEIAAVILEPMMCNSGAIAPLPGFLESLRELCTKNGTVLIFDEVITGFRLAPGGAAERFGVTPDLAVYGKALAGGWPAAALAGRQNLMELIGTGSVNHSGTFNASVMASAAVAATMDLLAEDPPYERIAEHGSALMNGIVELGRAHGLPFHVQGMPVAFHVSFPGAAGEASQMVCDFAGLDKLDLAKYERFARVLTAHGVWVAGRGIWYVSAAHGATELRDTLARVDESLSEFAPAA